MMNTAMEKTLEAWAADWSSPDVEHLLSLFTDDCIYEDVTLGAVNHGKAELKAFADGVFAAFPDFKIEQTARFVAGEWAGMEWRMSGTHQGDLPGMPATHQRFSLRGATILELESGKIKRCSDYWDLATFLKQVGLMPPAQDAK
ncbi:MAG TPA: ester cyclase [Blastocatellia bacterium]|nr:ester cyclase [Blastocatellia bacterium]